MYVLYIQVFTYFYKVLYMAWVTAWYLKAPENDPVSVLQCKRMEEHS